MTTFEERFSYSKVYYFICVNRIFEFQNDELRRKLEDFDKVTKIKRSMTVDTAEHDREIRDLKNR